MFEHENAIFLHEEVRNVFLNKTVVVLGDSIQRSVYKDLVCLWHDPRSRYLTENELRAKGELSFLGDKLLLGGQLGDRVNGVQYKEVREFREDNTVFRFYFITRCFNEYVESILNEFKTLKPDVIVINSCYWDVHHYGDYGFDKYKDNLNKLFSSVFGLPSRPLLVWNSALPLAKTCKGGFLRQGFQTIPRFHVVWANEVARNLTKQYYFLYVDLFNSLDRHQVFTQAEDGIHWGNRAHRKISNSVLTAISLEWKKPIPLRRCSVENFTSPPRKYQHSWPEYQYDGFHYHDYADRSFDGIIARQDSYRPLPPSPFVVELRPSLNILPYVSQYFHTPPEYTINRYNGHYSLEGYPPFYRNGDLSPLTEYYPRYFSYGKPRVPKFNHYNRRFGNIKQNGISKKKPSTSIAAGSSTPLTPQRATATKIADTVKNAESENIDVTDNQGNTTDKALTCASLDDDNQESVASRKRKRDDEEDVQLNPPAKQIKAFDSPPVKCRLYYESFL